MPQSENSKNVTKRIAIRVQLARCRIPDEASALQLSELQKQR
jgi:hypothetical protein